MPTPASSEPIKKITINLYEKDIRNLKRWIGAGWQTRVRELVRSYCRQRAQLSETGTVYGVDDVYTR